MNRIKFIIAGLVFLSLTILPSCLKSGLDELPSFSGADITNISFEYRYQDLSAQSPDGEAVVRSVTLEAPIKNIDPTANAVTVTLEVPEADGTFTASERAKVALTNIVCLTSISTAAIIEPVDGAPLFGRPGDFSTPRTYQVTAADGTTKIWGITVTALNTP